MRFRFVIAALLAASLVLANLAAGSLATEASTSAAPAFALPFGVGQTWSLIGGPHNSNGCPGGGYDCPGGKPWSSLDFAGGDGIVRAVGAGKVHLGCGAVTGPGSNLVRIDHGGGWQTTYYHLISISVRDNQPVSAGTPLGHIGTGRACGGHADGAHVHFSLWHFTGGFNFGSNSEQHDLEGISFGDWVVHDGGLQYQGCMVRSTNRQCADPLKGLSGRIYNDGAVLGGTQHAAVALIPGQGASGYRADSHGGLHPFGSAPAVTSASPTWAGLDIVRGIALFPSSTTSSVKGYVLDAYGGLHPFAAGGAAKPATPALTGYWNSWDIARGFVLRGNSGTGYVLDGWGGIHPFAIPGAAMPAAPATRSYWKGWDIARGIVLTGPGTGYVLDGWGGVHPFAVAGSALPAAPKLTGYWRGWDIARALTMNGSDAGYVLDGWGGIHPFAIPGAAMPATPTDPGYASGKDIFRGIAYDSYTADGVAATGDRPGTPGQVYKWRGTPRPPARYTLTVTKSGAGAGVVSGPGISCGSTCSSTYNAGTTVTLTAAVSTGSDFIGFTGAGCAGPAPCTVTLTSSQTVNAEFEPHVNPGRLFAFVGPKKKLTLLNARGHRVTSIRGGPYVITVRDRTKKDNFHLVGTGVNSKTGIRFRGRAVWHVTLVPGARYVYRSDAHHKRRRSFRVT